MLTTTLDLELELTDILVGSVPSLLYCSVTDRNAIADQLVGLVHAFNEGEPDKFRRHVRAVDEIIARSSLSENDSLAAARLLTMLKGQRETLIDLARRISRLESRNATFQGTEGQRKRGRPRKSLDVSMSKPITVDTTGTFSPIEIPLTSLRSNIAAVKSNIDTDESIETMKNDMTSLRTDVSAVKSDIAAVTSNIDTAESIETADNVPFSELAARGGKHTLIVSALEYIRSVPGDGWVSTTDMRNHLRITPKQTGNLVTRLKTETKYARFVEFEKRGKKRVVCIRWVGGDED